MNLVDVDDVGAKPAKRVLDLLHDAGAARIAKHFSVLPFEPGLGSDDDARTQLGLGDRFADDLLRAAEAVDRRRVDDIDAVLDRCANCCDRFRLIGSAPHPATNRPRADRDARHFERCARNFGGLHLGLYRVGLLSHDATLP